MPRVANPLTGSFTGVGNSGTITLFQNFNVSISGTFVGTVQVQRTLDGGTTWLAVSLDSAGTAANFTAPVSVTGYEPQAEVSYRLSCTAYTSGTINYRLSQ